VDSIGTLSYFLVGSLLESIWSLCGLHRDFVVFFSREFTSLYILTPYIFCFTFSKIDIQSV